MSDRCSLAWLRISIVPSIVAAVLLPGYPVAQEEEAALVLEEVVVTATKREENVQDVALSISAITADSIESMQIDKWDDADIPAVHISQGGANDSMYIRGVGSGANTGFEQSAPMFIDGAWYGRALSQRLAFFDLQRIEIVKGPQPTYLGKNATAGAVAVTTRRPTDSFESAIDAFNEFEDEEATVFGALSGPLSDRLSGRIAAKYRDLDGYLTNVALGSKQPKQEERMGRASLLWNPTDSLEVFAKVEVINAEEEGRNTQLVNCQPIVFTNGQVDPAVEDCRFDDTRANSFDLSVFQPAGNPFFTVNPADSFVDIDYLGGQIALDWQFAEGHRLTSTTSYYDQEMLFFWSIDHTTTNRLAIDFPEDNRLFSEELRVTSPEGGRLDWMVGLYYDDTQLKTGDFHQINAVTGIGLAGGLTEDDQSWSVFSEAGYEIVEALTARVGFRYTEVEKEAEGFLEVSVVNPMANFPVFSAPFTKDELNREGFKAGGFDHFFNSLDPAQLSFDEETVTYYEIGAKWGLLDGRATLNLSGFSGDYEDLQVQTFDVGSGLLIPSNAGKLRSRGVDLEAQWAANQYLTFSTLIAYLDSEWQEYTGVNCWLNPPQTAAEGCDPVTGTQDLSGETAQFAPEWSGTVSIDFLYPLGGTLELRTLLELFSTDDYQTNANNDPDQVQEGYSKLNARVGVGSQDGNWDLALVGTNLTDELVAFQYVNAPSHLGRVNAAITQRGRQLGVQFRYRFE